MSLVLTYTGEYKLLESMITSGTADPGLVFGLFSNDYTPTRSTTLSNLTEVTGGGYARISTTNAAWGTVSQAGGASFSSIPVTTPSFLFTSLPSNLNIYGYFILTTAGAFVGAERFTSAPHVLSEAGERVRLWVTAKLESEDDLNGALPYKWPTTTENYLLESMLAKREPNNNLVLWFYSNDYTPVESSVFSDFTRITSDGALFPTFYSGGGANSTPTSGGYAKLGGAGTSWSGITITPTSYNGTAYGFMIADSAQNIYMAERFASPLQFTVGVGVKFNPVFTLRDKKVTA